MVQTVRGPGGGDGRASKHDLSRFVESLRDAPRTAFLTLRALCLSLGPDVVERVGSDHVAFLRRDREFAVARANRGRLSVVLPDRTPLDDPNGRIVGRGESRHVPLDTPEALDGHVQEFVRKLYQALR